MVLLRGACQIRSRGCANRRLGPHTHRCRGRHPSRDGCWSGCLASRRTIAGVVRQVFSTDAEKTQGAIVEAAVGAPTARLSRYRDGQHTADLLVELATHRPIRHRCGRCPRRPAIPPMDASSSARVDSWIWAVRLVATRSAATPACRAGHVKVNGERAKAAQPVRFGDEVRLRTTDQERTVRVARLVSKRVGAIAEQGAPRNESDAIWRNCAIGPRRSERRGTVRVNSL